MDPSTDQDARLLAELQQRRAELRESMTATAGEFVYIPPGVPHVVRNTSGTRARFLVAHTAADDQEGIVLLPELDALVR